MDKCIDRKDLFKYSQQIPQSAQHSQELQQISSFSLVSLYII